MSRSDLLLLDIMVLESLPIEPNGLSAGELAEGLLESRTASASGISMSRQKGR